MLVAGEVGVDLEQNFEADLPRVFDQRLHVLQIPGGRIRRLEVGDVGAGQRRTLQRRSRRRAVVGRKAGRLQERREGDGRRLQSLDVTQGRA